MRSGDVGRLARVFPFLAVAGTLCACAVPALPVREEGQFVTFSSAEALRHVGVGYYDDEENYRVVSCRDVPGCSRPAHFPYGM